MRRTFSLFLFLFCIRFIPYSYAGIEDSPRARQSVGSAGTQSWGDAIQAARPAVVVIQTDKGLGSGFLIKADGTILTNAHIVAGATNMQVKLSTGEVYHRVHVLSSDDAEDIAILRIEAADLSMLPLANSNEVKVGDEVLLLGAPLGLEQTVSTGLVSAVRVTEKGIRVIQTTAAASPGSSGGPLLNRKGEVIGLISFGATEGQNLNFAIAINYARGKMDSLPLTASRTLDAPATDANNTSAVLVKKGGVILAGLGTGSFQYVYLELMNFLASRNVDIANETAGVKPMTGEVVSLNYYLDRLPKSDYAGLLYLTVDRGGGVAHKLRLQCFDKGGKLLWEEKSSSLWSWATTEMGGAKAATEQLEKKIVARIGKPGLPLKKGSAN